MKLYDLKNTKQDKKRRADECEVDCQPTEAYPWDTKLNFTSEVVSKITGLDKVQVGDKLVMQATVEVIGISKREEVSQKEAVNVELQMTKIGFEQTKGFDATFKEAAK